MTNVKQELPFLRDEAPRTWLCVSDVVGRYSRAMFDDSTMLLPKLEPEQQEACACVMCPGTYGSLNNIAQKAMIDLAELATVVGNAA